MTPTLVSFIVASDSFQSLHALLGAPGSQMPPRCARDAFQMFPKRFPDTFHMCPKCLTDASQMLDMVLYVIWCV